MTESDFYLPYKLYPRPYILVKDSSPMSYLCTDGVIREAEERTIDSQWSFHFDTHQEAKQALEDYINKQEKENMTFNFIQALTHLKEGKKVRITTWSKDMYIHITPIYKRVEDQNNKEFHLACGECIMNDNWKWELYDESIPVSTLKPGDVFSFSGLPGKKYRLLPAYMMEYVKRVREVKECDTPLLPCIGHEGFDKPDLCYIPSDMKVIKEN